MALNLRNSTFVALVAGVLFAPNSASHAVTIAATDLDYGISARQSNSFNFDFSADPNWTAGSQRSTNGAADSGNQRAGRVFVDFQLTAPVIAAAQVANAYVKLDLSVLSIGAGVAGTPYTDGLDLRFLGTSASDRSAATLWNTAGVGGDQADIVGVAGPAGNYSILLTNPSVRAAIAAATPGTFLSFGLSNSVGVLGYPVGNSIPETYGFQMSQTLANYRLSVEALPEPATGLLLVLAGGAMMRRRRIA